MAKELPYFKFFCSEWNDGDITLEEMQVQGVFINVCSYYWSNECCISIEKLKKRFKHNSKEIDYLFKNNLLHNENGFLSIHFLDEQQEDRKQTSKQNSHAGKVSAERRRLAKIEQQSNEDSTPVEITLNGNPTNKRREEKRREEKNNTSPKVDGFDFSKLLDFINKTYEGNFRVINKTTQAKYKARLKDGYTKDDILNAIVNCKNDSFHKEQNYKYCTPLYFSKDKTLDMYRDVKEIKSINPQFG